MRAHDITGGSCLAYRDNVTLCAGPVSALTEAVCLTPELAAASPAQTRLGPAWARDTDVAGAMSAHITSHLTFRKKNFWMLSILFRLNYFMLE